MTRQEIWDEVVRQVEALGYSITKRWSGAEIHAYPGVETARYKVMYLSYHGDEHTDDVPVFIMDIPGYELYTSTDRNYIQQSFNTLDEWWAFMEELDAATASWPTATQHAEAEGERRSKIYARGGCMSCDGTGYAGPDGHTCERCEGSGVREVVEDDEY